MKRRIIAALMCLCMLVGLLPTTALAADSKYGSASTVSAKFYYIYNNMIPNPPQTGKDLDKYGPSGNNEPFITVQINMEQLFQKVGETKGESAEEKARGSWWVDESSGKKERGYVTAESCQYYKEENGKYKEENGKKLLIMLAGGIL